MTELRAEVRGRVREAKLTAKRARKLTTWLFYHALCERLPPRKVEAPDE